MQLKMQNKSEPTPHHRRYTDGKQACAKIFNIICHWIIASENNIEIAL